ncbi:6-hydroxymethylpterin diphosphokinase MptE-like protein [Longirhabdus pacifica]|uniref:6-hydroxymethylpterin diphosphokinase MptE-like protein n=1 Tax=Longirhabdus pacifica TaxID=2305227 RepID=UPI001008AEC1|nr:6-hydroxymethylpterin diphosphokinase MptE-like protein [Longirhabdus pacifica]
MQFNTKGIKNVIKSNRLLYWFVRQVRKIQYYYIPSIKFLFFNFLRKNNIWKNKRVESIKKFKNKHQDDRCFIVATGPSLRVDDIEKLSGEITIGMNSICKIGNKTNWRPTYYGIQDIHVYRNLKEDIIKLNKTEAIFISSDFPKKEKIKNSNVIEMPIYGKNHLINPNADNIEFSNDCYDVIHDGYTITYSLLQLAVYMGFKEIYLIGADTSYAKKGPHHFIETGIIDPYFNIAGERMNRAYGVAKHFADQNGIKIYNATRGGFLEVFERVDFDKLELKSLERGIH